jgi:23S rRNA (uracil1939-C5)-methyltransferase
VFHELEYDIIDLSHDGRGVARMDGKAVFVAGALPGERVRAQQTSRKRHFDEARTVEVLQASPTRVQPLCPHFGTCGGCVLQHLEPSEQIAAKQRVLIENLERIGHVQAERMLPPLADQSWGYRRKARLGVKHVAKKGRVLVGFRETNPKFVAELSRCEVLIPAVGERIDALAALIESLSVRDSIPQIEVAAGDSTTALVFRNLRPLTEADRSALIAFGREHGFAMLLQSGGVDSLELLWPEQIDLDFRIDGGELRLRFEPLDFVQVNAGMNQRMIAHALELLDPQSGDRVLDLFCGLGNFTLPIARRVAHVVGVEGDAGLVQRARANATANGIANADFHAADLTRDLRSEPWAREGFDKLLLDPPRSGAEAAIPQLPLAGVQRLVYVSCHPGSLARDAGTLVREHGFRLTAAGAMDMFPHTAHVESIALFER